MTYVYSIWIDGYRSTDDPDMTIARSNDSEKDALTEFKELLRDDNVDWTVANVKLMQVL